jgi:hypothetical protein
MAGQKVMAFGNMIKTEPEEKVLAIILKIP